MDKEMEILIKKADAIIKEFDIEIEEIKKFIKINNKYMDMLRKKILSTY